MDKTLVVEFSEELKKEYEEEIRLLKIANHGVALMWLKMLKDRLKKKGTV